MRRLAFLLALGTAVAGTGCVFDAPVDAAQHGAPATIAAPPAAAAEGGPAPAYASPSRRYIERVPLD
ncbi:MAG: hypothetical protein ACXWC6_02935 [Ramlibacter sp.]